MDLREDRARITIGFSELSDADANVCAGELLEFLRDDVEGAALERVRADPATQDLGTVVVAVVSSAAAVQIARGVRAWLESRGAAERNTLLDWSSTGLVLRGLRSADMVKVVEHLTRSPAPPEAPPDGPAAE